jgi:hypothetical protein
LSTFSVAICEFYILAQKRDCIDKHFILTVLNQLLHIFSNLVLLVRIIWLFVIYFLNELWIFILIQTRKRKKNWKHILAKSTSVSYRQVDVHENKFVKAIFWQNQVRYSIHLRNNAAKSKNYKVYNVIVSWYYIYYCYFIFRLISIFCRKIMEWNTLSYNISTSHHEISRQYIH